MPIGHTLLLACNKLLVLSVDPSKRVLKKQKVRKRKLRMIGTPVITYKRQLKQVGCYKHFRLYFDLRRSSPERFYECTRMSFEQFDYLVRIVQIRRGNQTFLRRRIPLIHMNSAMKLALTLRYLASGGEISSIATENGLDVKTVQQIFRDSCDDISFALTPMYLSLPSEMEFKLIAEKFWSKYKLPHCLGAVIGKCIKIKAPINSPDYGDYFRISVVAAADTNYCFTQYDISVEMLEEACTKAEPRPVDQLILFASIKLPPPCELPGSNIKFHYFFIGEEDCDQERNLLTPISSEHLKDRTEKALSNKLFNQRLDRVKTVTENAFGILAAKWRLFHQVIQADDDLALKYVEAAMCLHNYTIRTSSIGYSKAPLFEGDLVANGVVVVPGKWRTEQEGSGWETVQLQTDFEDEQAGKNRDTLVRFLADDVFTSHNLR